MHLILVAGTFLAICVGSHFATSTREERRANRQVFARKWNPILLPVCVVLWAIIVSGFL